MKSILTVLSLSFVIFATGQPFVEEPLSSAEFQRAEDQVFNALIQANWELQQKGKASFSKWFSPGLQEEYASDAKFEELKKSMLPQAIGPQYRISVRALAFKGVEVDDSGPNRKIIGPHINFVILSTGKPNPKSGEQMEYRFVMSAPFKSEVIKASLSYLDAIKEVQSKDFKITHFRYVNADDDYDDVEAAIIEAKNDLLYLI